MIGGLIAKNNAAIGSYISGLSNNKKLFIISSGLMAYTYSFVIFAIPAKIGWDTVALFNQFIAEYIAGIASTIFIIFSIHDKYISNILKNRLFLFLGKISFSIYLVHIPILATALFLLSNFQKIYVVSICLPIIFILTFLFHVAVEIPSQKLGRKLFTEKTIREVHN